MGALKRKKEEQMTTEHEKLEAAIDDIGRDVVFERARKYGWKGGQEAPEWIWWGIVTELRQERETKRILDKCAKVASVTYDDTVKSQSTD